MSYSEEITKLEKIIALKESEYDFAKNEYKVSFLKLETYLTNFLKERIGLGSTLRMSFDSSCFLGSKNYGDLSIYVENKKARFSSLADIRISFLNESGKEEGKLYEEISYSSGSCCGSENREQFNSKLSALSALSDLVMYLELNIIEIKDLMSDTNKKLDSKEYSSTALGKIKRAKKEIVLKQQKFKINKIFQFTTTLQAEKIISEMKSEVLNKKAYCRKYIFLSFHDQDVKFEEMEITVRNSKPLLFKLNNLSMSQKNLKTVLESVLLLNGSHITKISQIPLELEMKSSSKRMNVARKSIKEVCNDLKKYITVLDF